MPLVKDRTTGAEDSFFICNFSAKRGEVTDITSKADRRKVTADSTLHCVVNLRTWNLRHSVLGARSGWPNFRDLLFRQRQCIFIAFDLLYLNGKDLRVLPLIERKVMLKKLLRRKRSGILYLTMEQARRIAHSRPRRQDLRQELLFEYF